MISGIINEYITYYFSVVNSQLELVSGIPISEFIFHIYNPYGLDVTESISNSISELGNGNYKFSLVPDVIGAWYIQIIHMIYFPWGKNESISIYPTDIILTHSLGCCVPDIVGENFGSINMIVNNDNVKFLTKQFIPTISVSTEV